MSSIWTSVAFIILTVLCVSFVTLIFKKAVYASDLPNGEKASLFRLTSVFLRAWLLIIAILGLSDFFSNTQALPPRVMLGVLPPMLGVMWLTRSKLIGRLIKKFPILWVYALQGFRVGVEIILHQLWKEQLIPQSMTFEGRNFDILIGLSAPLIGWLVYKKGVTPKLALLWNILGICVVSNVVITGVLSVPTPMRVLFEDYPNVAVGLFPYVWLPTVLVPLAYALHVVAIRYYLHSKNSK